MKPTKGLEGKNAIVDGRTIRVTSKATAQKYQDRKLQNGLAPVSPYFQCVNIIDGTYPVDQIPLYNRCDGCRTAVIYWSNGQTLSYNVQGHSTLLIKSESLSGTQVDDKPC